tara:strand:- start:622 stop:1449 length:828 start_codon:yes stop_codon:yes gene_type:complete
MERKVHYLLNRCTGKEWSGPAWYSVENDTDGFPIRVTLEHFHPLHLGTSGETDWDGKDLVKIYKTLRKQHPEIGKSWVQGNIHSHHSMGAFYSQVDVQQCIDGTFKDMFYYSLVVSDKVGKEFHFGASYMDQFERVHVDQDWDVETEEIDIVANKAWASELKIIRKAAKKNKVATWNYGKYTNAGNTQASLFNHYGRSTTPTIEEKQPPQERYEEWIDMMSYNGYAHLDQIMTPSKFEEFDEINLDYEKGRITKAKLRSKLKKLGVDEYGQPIPS